MTMTPYHFHCVLQNMWHDSSALQKHLDAGHDINELVWGECKSHGQSLLFMACSSAADAMTKKSDTLVKQLLQAGANPNVRTSKGYTPLMLAAAPDVASLLLDNGADIAAERDEGRTALEIASDAGHLAVVKVLLKHGGHQQLLKRSKVNCTTLSAAVNGGHEAVALLLLLVEQPNFNIDDPRLASNQPLLCACATAGLHKLAEAALDSARRPVRADQMVQPSSWQYKQAT
jgi:ankyrin repeat protein